MRWRITLVLGFCGSVAMLSQEPRKLTLREAIHLALNKNRGLAIATDKIAELNSATHIARSSYFPQLTNSSSYLHFTQTDVLEFAPGSLGTFPGIGSLPTSNLTVSQGELNNEISRTQLAQPLSQLLKIHDGHRMAQADENASREEFEALRNRVALIVRQLYYELLTVRLEQQTAAQQLQATKERLTESEQEASKGSALEVTLIGARASVLQAKQSELVARLRRSDLEAEFNEVIGLHSGTSIELDEQASPIPELPSKEECMRLAQSVSPPIRSADQAVRKVQAAVDAARAEYIPNISFFARHDYQNGAPFLFHNYGVVGLNLDYALFDGGRKHAVLREREAQRAQAIENLQRLKEDAAVNVEKAWNKMEQSRSLIEVARQTVALREEADRLARVRLHYAVIVSSEESQAVSDLAKARADLLKAELGYAEAQAELAVLIGRLPE